MASTARNTSNTVQCTISHAQLSSVDGGIVKSVDKAFADLGNTLNYTIVLKNTGNTTATNIVLTDTIPSGTQFVQNSVRVNGNPSGSNPQNGVNIPSLAPNATSTVTFQVTVTSIPNVNPIPNNANLTYLYTVCPSLPNGQSGGGSSNVVTTQVNHGQISPSDGGFTKTASKDYADVNDIITYTLVLKNTGNTAVNNTVVTDTIPNGTSFVPGSVTVNGSSGSGEPQTGINVGTVNAGSTVTITFDVKVLTIPNPNPVKNQAKVNYTYTVNPATPNGASNSSLSNETSSQINSAGFSSSGKTASPAYQDIGGIVTYTINVKNTGNVTGTNVTVFDTIPNGTTLVPNSVTVNGVIQPGVNPQNGVNVGTVPPNGSVAVTFKVVVNSIPTPNPTINQGYINYNYTVDPNNPGGASGSSQTGTSTNQINSGLLTSANGGLNKSVDKQYVSIGDTLTYTLNVKNVGNVPVNNLVVSDTIPSSVTFSNGSIIVNGTPQPGANINSGITLGNLNPFATATIVFKATVNTVPSSGKINNDFVASYSYTVNPSVPNGVSQKSLSNQVTSNVNDPAIANGPNSFSKVASKQYANLGDTITYTITLANTGNVPGNNVVLQDPIPNGTVLVPNSVSINGSPVSNGNPQSGINIGTLNPGSSAIVVFQVNVVSIPSPNPISNIANVTYTYTKDPSNPNGQTGGGTSNPANSQVNNGNVPANGFTKFGDKSIVKRGDVITYTVTIPNSGNVSISNVVFTDPLPAGTSLVPNSFIVNGTLQPNANPVSGVNLGQIGPYSTSVLQFKVLVNTIPPSGQVTNKGNVTYQYIVDPNQPPVQGNQSTNTSNIPIRDANINTNDGGFTKNVDKPYAQLGETVTYTFGLTNTGNVTATNVVFTDNLPGGLNFVQGSATLNTVTLPNANPQSGITIAAIGPNVTNTITFKATVTSIPADGILSNVANVTYNYIQDPNKPPVQGNGQSNISIINVNSPNFNGDNFKKSTKPYYATIGDIITYSFNINNTGNATAGNLTFTDTINPALKFVDNSVIIGGQSVSSGNPQTGIQLGNFYPGTSTTLSFKVAVTSLPSPNPVPDNAKLSYNVLVNPNTAPVQSSTTSNTVFNQINSPNLSVVKTSDADGAVVGDIITYTIVTKNNGNVSASNVVISDPLSPNLEFVTGSVVENGLSLPEADIISGVDIGTVNVGQTVTLTFKAKITGKPDSGTISNKASSSYEFIVDPNKPPIQGNTNSKPAIIEVGIAELTLIKKANTEVAKLNDIITYTVEIINSGTVTASNIIFRDELPEEVKFVPNTFYLDNKRINGVDLESGVNIGNLAPGDKATVKYDVILVKVCCDGTATNKAFATFNYKATANSVEKTKTVGPVSVKVSTTSSTFKEITLDGILVVPCPKLDIEEVNDLVAQVDITSYHVIKTVKGVSDENRRLTGYKLIINGVLTQTLEYTANDVVQSVHSAYFERKFSTFIVLPEDYQIGTSVRIKGVVEDVYYNQLNSREVFSNITLLIDASVFC